MRCGGLVFVVAVVVLVGCGKGGTAEGDADGRAAPAGAVLPGDDPGKLPKVAAEEKAIAAMLRERFGETVARRIHVAVENKPEGLRVGLSGDVPDEKFRVAIMNEVEARVEGIRFQDFNLEVAGPVPMLYGFEAKVRDGEFTWFAPDLTFAVTTRGGVYEMATGRRLNRINLGEDSRRRYMEMSPDGRTLAVSYRGGEIALYDLPMGQNRRVLQKKGPDTSFDDVVAMAFTADSKQLVTINRDNGDVRVWDLAKGSVKQVGSHISPSQPQRLGDRYHVAIAPDGKTIASIVDGSTELFLWDVQARAKLPTPKVDRLDPKAIAWSHDGKTIAVGRTTEEKRGVALYSVKEKQARVLATEQDELIRTLAFSPDDKTLAVVYESVAGSVRLWDVAGGKVWQTLEEKKVGSPTSVQFSQDGAVLATDCPGLRPPAIRMWEVSERPGAKKAVARMPRALPELQPRDDQFVAALEQKIRQTFSEQNIETLQVELLQDGTVKLSGKVSDSEVKRVAQLDAETFHLAEDSGPRPRNRVVNELQVTGRYGEPRPAGARMRGG